MKVKVDDLAAKIGEVLKEYEGVTDEAVDKGLTQASAKALASLHTAHPEGAEKYGSWSDYLKGWAVTRQSKKKNKTAIIHNKTHYRLAHLLEFGHAKTNGGRTRAFPHIAEAEKIAVETFESEIQKGL